MGRARPFPENRHGGFSENEAGLNYACRQSKPLSSLLFSYRTECRIGKTRAGGWVLYLPARPRRFGPSHQVGANLSSGCIFPRLPLLFSSVRPVYPQKESNNDLDSSFSSSAR